MSAATAPDTTNGAPPVSAGPRLEVVSPSVLQVLPRG
jgi:hypothetical protein